jgi:hypothetical protein
MLQQMWHLFLFSLFKKINLKHILIIPYLQQSRILQKSTPYKKYFPFCCGDTNADNWIYLFPYRHKALHNHNLKCKVTKEIVGGNV